MNAPRIAGMAWVTPLGGDLDAVFDRMIRGDVAEPKALANSETGRVHFYLPVSPKLVERLARIPRLRRSSAISYFGVAAGLGALEDAGIQMTPEIAARTAVVFAISDGGVIYTRKFYEQIVKEGAHAASPLLFPETVYNAPASHLAALLGIGGASYTLVGDNSVGLGALKFAGQLLDFSGIDQVVVVGAEEIDWVLCEAYRHWRLACTSPPREGGGPWKARLSEGAAALVLAREGRVALRAVHDGVAFRRRSEAAGAIHRVLSEMAGCGSVDRVISGANGTFADDAETHAVAEKSPEAVRPAWTLKRALGEAPGASALWQVIAAALTVEAEGGSALIPVVGFNQQASAAIVGSAR